MRDRLQKPTFLSQLIRQEMRLWPILYIPLRVIEDINEAMMRRTPPAIKAIAKEVGVMTKDDRRHYDATCE